MYENAKYYKAPLSDRIIGIMVEINGVLNCVPLDPANIDYSTIMKLVEEGKMNIAQAE